MFLYFVSVCVIFIVIYLIVECDIDCCLIVERFGLDVFFFSCIRKNLVFCGGLMMVVVMMIVGFWWLG